MTRRLGWLLAAAMVLAAALVLDRVVLRPSGTDTVSTPVRHAVLKRSETQTGSARANRLFLPPLATFSEIWTRPVFVPSRRPEAIMAGPRTPSGPAISNDQQPPAIKIVGVATGPAGGAALVRTSRNTVKRYYVGDVINGWTIEQIEPASVTVSRNGARWLLPVGVTQ